MAFWFFLGAALTGIGIGAQVYAQNKQSKAQEKYQREQVAQQQAAEAARRRQMELDAIRRQREVVRQSQRARSQALANATSNNAQLGSGLAGGYGQIQGQIGVNALGISQNLELGNQIFDANAAASSSSARYASAAGSYGRIAGIGSGLTSLGGAVVSNMETIRNIGTNSSGGVDPWAGMRQGSVYTGYANV